MIIKTKKYGLPKKEYIKLALKRTLLDQWWILLIFFSLMLSYFLIKSILTIILPLVIIVVYIGFWVLQFYGVTIMDQTKLIFEKVNYEITPNQITLQLSTKQGMPIEWKQIKKVYSQKDYFLLILSRAHIIYLPHKIFNNTHSIKMFETLLKRKKYIK